MPGRVKNKNLSEREIQVLSTFGNEGDFDHKLSAELLHISNATLKTHRQNIMDKLGLDNIFEAFFLAAHKGLIQNRRWEGRI